MSTPTTVAPFTNVTFDDFDCVINYTDPTQWTTPDPSKADYNSDSKEWLRGTWHYTDVVGAEVGFKFEGTSLSIYGHSGPSYGSYSITIDDKVTLTRSAFASSNASTPYILYTTTNLTDTNHSIRLRNLGKSGDTGGNRLLLDFFTTPLTLGAPGATLQNTTLEESSPQIHYSGFWQSNQSGNFSGGGSSFTNDLNASFTLTFNASAIYIFGDKKNDHGLYTVQLDNGPLETYNGISGCMGVFGESCEQQLPSVKWFKGPLGEGEHVVTVTNVRGNPEGKLGVNGTFFDLDSIVLTVPSKYPQIHNDSSTSTGNGSPSSATATSMNQNSGISIFHPQGTLFWAFMLMWVVRKVGKV